MVKAVVFDIGNVLMGWDPERVYAEAYSPEMRDEMLVGSGLMEMNDRVDLGADFDEEVDKLAAERPDYAEAILMWRNRWLDMARPEITLSSHLLRTLRAKGIRVIALSNFGIKTLVIAEAEYPVLTEFDARYVSGHMGVMKPDPQHIAVVLEKLGVAAADAVMIGDSRADLDAAKGLDMPCVLVRYGYTAIPVEELGGDSLIDRMDELHTVLPTL